MSTVVEKETPKIQLPPPPRQGYGPAWMGEEELELVTQVIGAKLPFRYYGPTPAATPLMAQTLEREIEQAMQVRYALGVTSGTTALEVALGALGVGPGDEVIVPAWSWVSCFTTVVRLGARPLLAEIDDSLCLDPAEIGRLRTSRTKAVLVVHYQGAAARMDEILAAARQTDLAVVEDCAEALGASYRGRPVGSMGDISMYSFQYNKLVSSGEGGAVVTNDPRLYERAVRMHDLGLYRPYHQQVKAASEPAFAGAQARMSELTAAVALAQFRKRDRIIAHCRKLSAIVREAVAEIPELKLRPLPDAAGETGIETYFWVNSVKQKDALKRFLADRHVVCQQVTGTACHYYRDYCRNRSTHAGERTPLADFAEWPAPGYRPQDFPRTEELLKSFVAIPVGCYYTETDAKHIADCLRAAALRVL